MTKPGELPILGQDRERKDAARNRRRILEAAERIVAEHGVKALTMNGVAAEAGVGVGTVYRRFGDTGQLAWAMLDDREHRLQQDFIDGPPPLGPGAPPLERIRGFLHAYADLVAYAPSLMAVAERTAAGGRYAGAYAVHRAHLVDLIKKVRPDADAEYLADALLAPLSAGLFLHQNEAHGMSVDRIKSGLDDLLRCLEP